MYVVSETAALVETIPLLLGYSATKAVVLHLMDSERLIVCVMQIDLGRAGGGAERASELAVREGIAAVAITIVDDAAEVGSHASLIGEFRAAFTRCQVEITQVVVVDRIAKGGRWWCAECGCERGVLNDPMTSLLAADTIARGRRIYGSRDELRAVVASDEGRADAFAAALSGVVGPVDRDAAVSAVVEALHRLKGGDAVPEGTLAVLALALGDVSVRDHLLSVSASGDTSTALALWTDVARVTTGVLRAEALSLTAACAYVLGAGAVASVAVEAALETQPGHSFSVLLSKTLSAGIRPDDLREMLVSQLRSEVQANQ